MIRILEDHDRNTIVFLWENGFWFEIVDTEDHKNVVKILWEQIQEIQKEPGKHVLGVNTHHPGILIKYGPIGYTFWFEKCT